MAFKKGQSGNLNGRPKGSKNKSTSILRAAITKFLENNIIKLESDFEKIKPSQRIRLLIELLYFAKSGELIKGHYIKRLLKESGWSNEAISSECIDIKRLLIKTKREIKNHENKD